MSSTSEKTIHLVSFSSTYHEGNHTTLIISKSPQISKAQIFGKLKTLAKNNEEVSNLVKATLSEACSVRAYVYKTEDITNKLEFLNKKLIRDKQNYIPVNTNV